MIQESMLKAIKKYSGWVTGKRSGFPISVFGPDDEDSQIYVTALHPQTGDNVGGFNLEYLPPGMGKPTRMNEHVPMHYLGVNAEVEVDPNYQRQGLASDMWDALEDHIHQNFPGQSVIDHGGFSPEGSAWWNAYAEGREHPGIHYY